MEQTVGMRVAGRRYWQNVTDFSGRSNRREYWWWQLWQLLLRGLTGAAVVVTLISPLWRDGASETGPLATVTLAVFILFNASLVIPNWALTARRYRDGGMSPWLVVLTHGIPETAGLVLALSGTFGLTVHRDIVRFWVARTDTILVFLIIVGVGCLLNLALTLRPSKFTFDD